MSNKVESGEEFWARYKEAEKITTDLKGPCPPPPGPKEAILGGFAGGAPAFLALAIAGVYGDRLEYITLAVAVISAGAVYFVKRLAYSAWHKEMTIRLRQTEPK